MNNVTHLECSACGMRHEAGRLHNVCSSCGKPLFVRYNLADAARSLTKDSLRTRRADMWRYREVLPVRDDENIISLGEGWTPLLEAKRLGASLGFENLLIKDESLNPTQSFKARGMSAAVSMAKELGVAKVAAPSAGNAGGALAAYAARAGIEAHIFVPRDTPRANLVECERLGAHVTLIDGLITDCGAEVARRKDSEGWFDMSTLKEPYRVEGKKTLGYELAEQLHWKLPDVIVYPTGGGTGLVGMWKAFDEMEALGWIGSKRPRMVSVQSEGCAPVVRAFEEGDRFAEPWQDAHSRASGIRVPSAVGDFLILDALRESGGTAVAVEEDSITDMQIFAGRMGAGYVSPESAAALAAVPVLRGSGEIGSDDDLVVFDCGIGQKYPPPQDLPEPPVVDPDDLDIDALAHSLR